MNAIKNYLDNMFRNLPNTEEVRRAKSELLQMMEDKFEELMSEGKTENEAVGIVISEFGNLDEVAESIGISQIIRDNKENTVDKPMLSMDRVKEYLSTVSTRSLMIPLAVALCIMSVTTGITAELLSFGNSNIEDALGGAGFFIFIAAAVVLFVLSRTKNKEFDEINKDQVSLGIETCDYVRNERRRFKPTYSTMVAIGIALCIACVVFPIIISAIPFLSDSLIDSLGGLTFFFSIAVGVFLIVSANVRMNGYDRLLKLNGAGMMSEEFIPKEDRKISKAPIIISIIAVVIVLGIAAITGAVRIFSWVTSTGGEKVSNEYELDIGDADTVNKISVDADACSVIIRVDNSVEGIEARYEGDDRLMPEVNWNNGELVITQDVDSIRNNLREGPELVILIGSDMTVEDLSLDMDAGNLEIYNLEFDEMTGEFDAGKVELVNCTSGFADITADAGDVEISGSDIDTLNLGADAGNIEISDTNFEDLTVDVEFGNIDVSGIRDIDYYTIEVSCSLGDVDIDHHGQGGSYYSSGEGSGSISVECNCGSISIS